MSIKIKRFTNGLRVTVLDGPLKGISGIVRRCRMAYNGAWVEMESIPKGAANIFPFSNDEGDSWEKYTLLYPEDCTLGKVEA